MIRVTLQPRQSKQKLLYLRKKRVLVLFYLCILYVESNPNQVNFRQKEDPWNSIASGAAAGAVMVARHGPKQECRIFLKKNKIQRPFTPSDRLPHIQSSNCHKNCSILCLKCTFVLMKTTFFLLGIFHAFFSFNVFVKLICLFINRFCYFNVLIPDIFS